MSLAVTSSQRQTMVSPEGMRNCRAGRNNVSRKARPRSAWARDALNVDMGASFAAAAGAKASTAARAAIRPRMTAAPAPPTPALGRVEDAVDPTAKTQDLRRKQPKQRSLTGDHRLPIRHEP